MQEHLLFEFRWLLLRNYNRFWT